MSIIADSIHQSIAVKTAMLQDDVILAKVQQVADLCVKSLRAGGKIHFCGNGGSAADAQHLAAELSGRFYINRPALNAEALHCNTSYLTAVANDFGYVHIYSRLIEGTAKKGDVVIGISTSGNSENIVEAFEKAREMGVHTVAMTGEAGGKMAMADFLLNVPSKVTPRIQESHILLGHIICELIEKEIFG